MELLRVSQESDLVLFPVRLQPRSSRNEVVGLFQGALKIRLTAPPVNNQANRSLLGFLAKSLGLPAHRVLIASGYRSKNKIIGVKGLSQAELLEKITRCLA